MSSYIIKGGNKLEGTVRISGSKNASLPIIAATILNKGTTTLYNVPNIQDTQMMYEIIKLLGGKVQKKKNKVRDWLINFCIAWTIVDVIEDVWKWCNRKKPPFP